MFVAEQMNIAKMTDGRTRLTISANDEDRYERELVVAPSDGGVHLMMTMYTPRGAPVMTGIGFNLTQSGALIAAIGLALTAAGNTPD